MEQTIRRGGTWTPDGFLFELTGGDPSLDFVNTVDMRPTDHPKELIPGYKDLCSWGRQTGLLSRETEDHLVKKAERRPTAAERARKQAVAARECLFQVLSHVADEEAIPGDLLQQWNRFVHRTMGQYELKPGTEGLTWHCAADRHEFDSILWPVIHAAVQLLTGPNVSRIRRCAGVNCNWMFLDTSKRGNRRWCDMTVCGNRAKARRFYSKKKGTKTDGN